MDRTMFTLQRDTHIRLLTSTYCNFLQGAKIVVLCKPGGNEHLIRISQPTDTPFRNNCMPQRGSWDIMSY